MIKILGHKNIYNDGDFEAISLKVEITDERKKYVINPEVEVEFYHEGELSDEIVMWDMPLNEDGEGKRVPFKFTEKEEQEFFKYVEDNKLTEKSKW